MAVTIHALETSGNSSFTWLRPGLSNLTAKYKSLDHMCQELGIERDDIEKMDERGLYPSVASQASHRVSRYCTTVRIKGEYLLLTWEDREEHLAAYAYLFPRGSRPFTKEAMTSPPPPPVPKYDSEKTLKEFLFGRWKGETPTTTLFT